MRVLRYDREPALRRGFRWPVSVQFSRLHGVLMPAIYVGPLAHLQGKTALIRNTGEEPEGRVLAQFDERDLTRSGIPVSRERMDDALGFGWHLFRRDEFEVKA